MLEEDATVYKLIGPVLVKQDLAEARQNVDKRIAYIKTEMLVFKVLIEFSEIFFISLGKVCGNNPWLL